MKSPSQSQFCQLSTWARRQCKLLQAHRRHIFQLSARHLFSVTGKWDQKFTGETRIELEKYWKRRVQQQNAAQKKDEKKPKYYVLSMFPYPSGKLHMGHVRVYTISDTMARYHRMMGKNVIHPMGWDAFGLPAENAAIERGELPEEWTYSNICSMKKQLEDLCCSFDWEREYATCDPEYYQWTQYIFLKMYEMGLVYRKEALVNWDPVDETVLADEQVDEGGRSWRSGAIVEKRHLEQWYIRTTAYAKSLDDGLNDVDEDLWRDIVQLQRHWIGDCVGCRIEFQVQDQEGQATGPLSLFTDTPEAMYGISHILLSPDHHLNKQQFYATQGDSKQAEGNLLLNVKAVNPFTQQTLPIYVSYNRDYGEFSDSHLGIPSCSSEDAEFAREHSLPIQDVLHTDCDGKQCVINSGKLSGLSRQEAFNAAAELAKKLGCGGDITSEKLRDWLISRQRYWGTPIPMVHCPKHGVMPVPYDDLPVTLPKVSQFTGKGSSPLAQAEEWLHIKCSKCDCDGYARRETDTMDTFVDSSWYYLRYLDPTNKTLPFSADRANEYMPVDLYIGGKEHAIMHLYYARFFNQFLCDQGMLQHREPFINLLTQGMVMGQSYKVKATAKYIPHDQVDFSGDSPVEKGTGEALDIQWEKMSKSKYNGVDPQDVLNQYGVDSTRLCILSNVAPKSNRHWDPQAFSGVLRWQGRIWSLVTELLQSRQEPTPNTSNTQEERREQEKAIFESRNYYLNEVSYHMKKTFLLNSAISRLQTLTSILKKTPIHVMASSYQYQRAVCDLVIMVAPFAPLFASELWAGLSSVPDKLVPHYSWDKTVLEQAWPQIDTDYKPPLVVRVNDKELFEYPLEQDILSQLTKQQAKQILEQHETYPHIVDMKITHIHFENKAGYKAELTVSVKDKKYKKKLRLNKQKGKLSQEQ